MIITEWISFMQKKVTLVRSITCILRSMRRSEIEFQWLSTHSVYYLTYIYHSHSGTMAARSWIKCNEIWALNPSHFYISIILMKTWNLNTCKHSTSDKIFEKHYMQTFYIRRNIWKTLHASVNDRSHHMHPWISYFFILACTLTV